MDSFAFSEYYFLNGNKLFSPGNLNLQSIDGRCASEFPIVYYIASLTYSIFGLNFVSLKIITLLLLFFGFLFCIKTILLLSNELLTSFILGSLFFSSTVILYYGSLYLPDVHAFSLCLISFYFFISYTKTLKGSDLIFLYLFITLATLLKASFYYYNCVFFLLLVFLSKSLNVKINKNVIYFILSTVIIAAWYFFVRKYNELNFAYYYTTKPRPFWEYSHDKILQTFYSISVYWYSKYYFQSTFHFFYSAVLIYIFFIKKLKLELWLILLLAVFSGIYFCLFLIQFIDHDYYFIALIPSIIAIVSVSFVNIRKRFKNKILDYSLTVFILILTLLSLNYAKLNLHRRYTNNLDSYSIVRYQLNKAEDFLDAMKIAESSKFLVIGDRSQNGSLVLLNRFGWTYANFHTDSSSIKSNLSMADYLVVLKPSENRVPQDILDGLKNCDRFSYNSNYIFSLKNYRNQ